MALVAAAVPSAAAGPAGEGSGTSIHIRFDVSAAAGFLRLVRHEIIDDDSLDAWIDLPANAEILRIGSRGGRLSREGLRENLWHSILGHPGLRGSGLGNLEFEPIQDLEFILLELEAREAGIVATVKEHVAGYLPPEVGELEADVRFHLGGTWGARTSDAIYLNLSRLHEFRPPWLGSLEVILAHELVHLAHAKLAPLPGDAKTPDGLFGVAISQIQSEGYARHVGFDLMERLYTPGGYARFVHRRHQAELDRFAEAMGRLERMRHVCLRQTGLVECRKLIREGVRGDGDAYAAGHGMAKAIEQAVGRKTLATTLTRGPGEFFRLYKQATRMLGGLPTLGDGFEKDLALAEEALADLEKGWRLRRESHALHQAGDYEGAARLLRSLLELEPQDEVAAYNLACALALQGRSKDAMEWLTRAVLLGYSNREHLAQDPDLSILRQREDFRRLLEGLAAPPSESSPKTRSQ